ncbi:hypothetical protein NMY22_g12669 [Coprinellus aureogranulatus]|nr:hypothetical protein NMY22_g12669 [Coprinellus aureogranulatus]
MAREVMLWAPGGKKVYSEREWTLSAQRETSCSNLAYKTVVCHPFTNSGDIIPIANSEQAGGLRSWLDKGLPGPELPTSFEASQRTLFSFAWQNRQSLGSLIASSSASMTSLAEGPGHRNGSTPPASPNIPDSAPSIRDIRKDRFITYYDALKLIFSLFIPTCGGQCLLVYDSSLPQYRGIWGRLPKVAGSLPLRISDIRFANNNTLPNAILERLLAKCGDLTSLTLDVHTPSHRSSDDFISPHLLPFLSVLHLVCQSEFRVHIWGLSVGSELSAGQDIVDLVSALAPDEGRNFGLPEPRRLRSLQLPIGRVQRGYYPPLSCLTEIPRRAPGLRRVVLSIDSSIAGQNGETLQSLLDKCSGLESTSGLCHLQLADTHQRNTPFTPTQYRDLARFLDTLFPNLESVSMMDSPFRDKN